MTLHWIHPFRFLVFQQVHYW